MGDDERYLFDLMGYLVVEDVLGPADLRELNELVDQRDPWGRRQRDGEGVIVGNESNLHIGPLHQWGDPFCRLIDHPHLRPYLVELIGPKFRYDHGYGIFMRQDGSRHKLHGGNTPYFPGLHYDWRDGQMHNGLIVVSYALGDVGPDDGGFACVPGSHKANLPCPPSIRQLEWTGPWLVQVPQKAGSVLIFTEALTHGTWPWTAENERRSLLYKYTPGHMAHTRNYPSPDDVPDAIWPPELRRILEPPYIGYRPPIADPS